MPIKPDLSDLPCFPARLSVPLRALFAGLREDNRVEPKIDMAGEFVILNWSRFVVYPSWCPVQIYILPSESGHERGRYIETEADWIRQVRRMAPRKPKTLTVVAPAETERFIERDGKLEPLTLIEQCPVDTKIEHWNQGGVVVGQFHDNGYANFQSFTDGRLYPISYGQHVKVMGDIPTEKRDPVVGNIIRVSDIPIGAVCRMRSDLASGQYRYWGPGMFLGVLRKHLFSLVEQSEPSCWGDPSGYWKIDEFPIRLLDTCPLKTRVQIVPRPHKNLPGLIGTVVHRCNVSQVARIRLNNDRQVPFGYECTVRVLRDPENT